MDDPPASPASPTVVSLSSDSEDATEPLTPFPRAPRPKAGASARGKPRLFAHPGVVALARKLAKRPSSFSRQVTTIELQMYRYLFHVSSRAYGKEFLGGTAHTGNVDTFWRDIHRLGLQRQAADLLAELRAWVTTAEAAATIGTAPPALPPLPGDPQADAPEQHRLTSQQMVAEKPRFFAHPAVRMFAQGMYSVPVSITRILFLEGYLFHKIYNIPPRRFAEAVLGSDSRVGSIWAVPRRVAARGGTEHLEGFIEAMAAWTKIPAAAASIGIQPPPE